MGRKTVQGFVEIPSSQLADWLERNPDSWWNVDGDPLLQGRLSIPCPSDELSAELRKIGRPLLVETEGKQSGSGESGGLAEFDRLIRNAGERLGSEQEMGDRYFVLSWKETPEETWLLIEDQDSARQNQEDAAANRR